MNVPLEFIAQEYRDYLECCGCPRDQIEAEVARYMQRIAEQRKSGSPVVSPSE